jgi:GTP cyclohydrolase IA
MHTMGLDLSDDSLRDTPKRVAKMYINEFFSGLNPKNKPSVSLFDNQYQYGEILIEKNIRVHSYCEHHFVPITGVAHIAYKSSGKVIGLSKLNRIVDYYSRRPQVQERLTRQIGQDLCRVLETDDVAVIIDAAHMCVSSRGIKDPHSSTITAEYSGCFKDLDQRKELLALLKISD